MKKIKVSIVALAFVASAGLVACGGTQTPTTGSDTSMTKDEDTSTTQPMTDTSGTGRDTTGRDSIPIR